MLIADHFEKWDRFLKSETVFFQKKIQKNNCPFKVPHLLCGSQDWASYGHRISAVTIPNRTCYITLDSWLDPLKFHLALLISSWKRGACRVLLQGGGGRKNAALSRSVLGLTFRIGLEPKEKDLRNIDPKEVKNTDTPQNFHRCR